MYGSSHPASCLQCFKAVSVRQSLPFHSVIIITKASKCCLSRVCSRFFTFIKHLISHRHSPMEGALLPQAQFSNGELLAKAYDIHVQAFAQKSSLHASMTPRLLPPGSLHASMPPCLHASISDLDRLSNRPYLTPCHRTRPCPWSGPRSRACPRPWSVPRSRACPCPCLSYHWGCRRKPNCSHDHWQ